MATKLAEYGHACLESHPAADNHDRPKGTVEASPDHGSHLLARISHDSGLIRESARFVAKNCWLSTAGRHIQTRSSSFNSMLPPFHEVRSCFCTKPASYSLPWALSACCNPNNERGLRG